MTSRLTTAVIALGFSLAGAGEALAWGSTGHRIVGELAAEAFPADMPAFLLTPQAKADIGQLARELDRSKGSGRMHGSNRDPAHFIDLDDEGGMYGAAPFTVEGMPPTRAAFEKALQAIGKDSWEAGYLPYAVIEGWQQLVKDFTHWRILVSAEKLEKDPVRKGFYSDDRRRREALIINNLGIWAHYLGDGSQPLHNTTHYNGWGKYPNPKGFTMDPIHAPFEGEFVLANVTQEAVRAKVPPYRACGCSIEQRTIEYLSGSQAKVEPLYQMWKDGEFARTSPKAVDFVTVQLALSAAELRDMTVEAWRASATGSIGYRETLVTPAEAEAGVKDPWLALWGDQ